MKSPVPSISCRSLQHKCFVHVVKNGQSLPCISIITKFKSLSHSICVFVCVCVCVCVREDRARDRAPDKKREREWVREREGGGGGGGEDKRGYKKAEIAWILSLFHHLITLPPPHHYTAHSHCTTGQHCSLEVVIY